MQQVRAYFNAAENHHKPRINALHEAAKDKRALTGTGRVQDGSSRGINNVSMPAGRAQANQGVGKVPKPIPASP